MQYCIDKGWAVNIEFTDDPHPRNTFWEMWGLPMFDIKDAAAVMLELDACRKVHADDYIRISGFDSSHGWESVRISFLVDAAGEGAGLPLDPLRGGGDGPCATRYSPSRRWRNDPRPLAPDGRALLMDGT